MTRNCRLQRRRKSGMRHAPVTKLSVAIARGSRGMIVCYIPHDIREHGQQHGNEPGSSAGGQAMRARG